MAHSSNLLLLPLKCTLISILIAVDLCLAILLLKSLQVLDLDISLSANNAHISKKSKNSDFRSAFDTNLKQTISTFHYTIEHTTQNVSRTIGSFANTVGDTTTQITKSITTTITKPETIIRPDLPYDIPKIEITAATPTNTTESTPQPTATPVNVEFPSVVWPIKGVVTTEFGTPHRPYQPTHTGIDISSHLPSGRASVTPFTEGVVTQVVHARSGLGNHIIIDHGNGITSYYAHLFSITVKEGQMVKPGDIIGYEGRTGIATGPHLHFEIRQNNVPINPRKFIPNDP